MSRFAQLFSRTRPCYKLDNTTNVLKKTDEVIDIQEEANSFYDETMYYRLESFFNSQRPNIEHIDAVVDDYDNFGNDADLFLDAKVRMDSLRERYELPYDLYTDSEVISIIRERSQNIGVPKSSTEGGEANETHTDAQS